MNRLLSICLVLLLCKPLQAQILDSFDINKTSVMNKHSGPDNFASDGTGLFFFATDSFCGRELYYFDGNTTPVNLTDITAGPQGSVSGTNIQVALFADNIFFS